MASVVQLAFQSVVGMGLTHEQKQQLIAKLNGTEEGQRQRKIEEDARKLLKPLTRKDLEAIEMEKWLLTYHFKSWRGRAIEESPEWQRHFGHQTQESVKEKNKEAKKNSKKN